MRFVVLLTLTFSAGLLAAWAWTRCIQAVQKKNALAAAGYDSVIVLASTVVTLTIWQAVQNDPLVLIAWTVGNALGTYLTVRK